MQGVTLGTIAGIIIQALLNFVPGLGEIAGKMGILDLGGIAITGANAASGAIAGGVSSATGTATSPANKAVGGIISGGLSSAVGSLMPLMNGGSFDVMSLLGALVSGGIGGGILGAIIPGKK